MNASPHKPKLSVSESSVQFTHSVERLFDPQGPKFIFDDIFHFSMRHYHRHRNNGNMLPVVKFMTATMLKEMGAYDAPIFFVPEAITNGRLYHDLAEHHARRIREVRGGRLTTYRMGEILNKDELDALTEKNKNRALSRVEGFRGLYPDHAMVSPTGMEAMLKTLVKDAGFTNYQMLRDEDFEGFWISVCLHAHRGGFADDVAYSRNGNFETFALFLVQYGSVPFRPNGDIDVVMPGKKSFATPYDYTQMLFAHVLDVVPRGFTSDLSVKMMMRMLMLEEMRTSGMAHPQWGALNPDRMNPHLRELGASHDRAFSRLRCDIMRFMHEHELGTNLGDLYGLDGYDDLHKYYLEREGPAVPRARPGGGGGHCAESAAKLDLEQKLQKKHSFNILNRPIPYQLDGDFFSAESRLLPDHSFRDLGRAEQVSLKAAMGLAETIKPPARSETSIILLTDRRGGNAADIYAGEHGLIIPGEARGAASAFSAAGFDQVVKTENILRAGEMAGHLRADYPSASLATMEDIEDGADIFRQYRAAIAAPGPERWSSAAKVIYAAEVIRRQKNLAVFDIGWERSAMLTALRLHARKIQLGMIDRPPHMMANALLIADAADNGRSFAVASLADDLTALTGYVGRLARENAEDYPRQAVRGLLETIAIIDLYYNHRANEAAQGGKGRLVDWQAVPLSAKQGLEAEKERVLELRHVARELILHHALTALSPDDLRGQLEEIDPAYRRAWHALNAAQAERRAPSAKSSSFQTLKGFDAS